MKTKHTIMGCVLVVGIVISGMALANSKAQGELSGWGFKRHYTGGGLMLLAKYQQKNLMVQMLSEMTGQSADVISTKIKEQRMRAVMQEYDIDRQEFRDRMQTKVRERVEQAAINKTITAEQEKEILEKMENRSKRRELMSQLIEKGIKDGTITREQAQMLMRKSR